MVNLEERKVEIQGLGLGAIKDYFNVNPEDLDKDVLLHLHNKAKIAMQFEKEMGVGKRAVEMTYLRVFRMIADDKKELKKYIKKTMPQYVPI